MRDYLFNTEKIKYVKGKKPDVDCILCSVRDDENDVDNLVITRCENFIISVNLYPFNPGHIMIFPRRHITDICDFTDEESIEQHRLLVKSLNILRSEFNPGGFNIGYNLGDNSGASIMHIHQHIVPRYGNEIGFLDVLAGTRIHVIDPYEMMVNLKKKFNK